MHLDYGETIPDQAYNTSFYRKHYTKNEVFH